MVEIIPPDPIDKNLVADCLVKVWKKWSEQKTFLENIIHPDSTFTKEIHQSQIRILGECLGDIYRLAEDLGINLHHR